MLRPTSRPGRFTSGALLTLFVVSLLVPVATTARTTTIADPAGAVNAPPAARTPKLEGRGVDAFDAGVGQAPRQPLQVLAADPAGEAATPAAPAAPSLVAAAPAAVLATSSGAPAATSFQPWAGLDQAGAAANCPSGASCAEREPADSTVAVGPNDVVQSVNTDFRFTTREGTTTKATMDAYEFFKIGTFKFDDIPVTIDGISDPRWLYDAKHDRWFATLTAWHCDDDAGTADDAYGFLLGALSATNDPTGDFYQFSVRYDYFLPVGAMVGTSGDKIVLGASEYALDPVDCAGALVKDAPSLLTLAWADLLTFPAYPANDYALFLPTDPEGDFTLEAPRPAISPKGTSNTVFGVMADDDLVNPSSNVVYFRITGTVTQATDDIEVTTSDLTAADIVPPFLSPPAPAQPGGTLPAAVDRHPIQAVWQDDILTFSSTYPCNPGGGTRACARVTQLGTSTTTPTRVQDMLIGTSGKDTWIPGVVQAQNGTLHVVYTQSSSSEGMTSYSRYQLPSDPLNTLSAAVKLGDGAGTQYDGSRWGDFTMPAQDPRDSNAVWQGDQYTKSDGSWATNVSELQTAGATFVPIDPVRVLDSRNGTGLTNPFTSNVARTLQVANAAGIPADAIAITGNLTVTQQKAAGFLAVTPTLNNAPSTSTLNFPLGDTRANNITSPLGTDGKLSIVYKAVSGKTAHVILDVTGYFLADTTGATYETVTPARSLDTRDGTGTGVPPAPLARATPLEWQITGLSGVPVGAAAVTGNLTIVNQTQAGFLTLGPDLPAFPTTSTLNVPKGDIRANGITVKLDADGRLTVVYSAIAGATTNVAFDVTGYYVNDLSGARFVPMTPGRRLDTRLAAPYEGLTGAFAANDARTLVVTPHQGVPNNAIAIAGNITVVNQSRAGFVAVTEVETDNPTTSTLNFPLGDIRANGVTTPLGSGSVGLVYKATSPATTNLIFDITGYFR